MMKGFIEGFTSYFRAINFVRKHKLYSYFLISGIISLAIGVSILSIAYISSNSIGSILIKLYPFENGSDYVETFLSFAAAGIVGVLGLLVYKYILLICVSPFMGPLSAKVEAIVTGQSTSSKFSIRETSYGFVRGVRLSIRNIIREISLTVLLLALSLIPLFTIFITPAIFFLQSYYAGFGNLDYFLERRTNLKQSVEFVKKNKGIAIGNGAAFLLLLFIPFLGLFLAPVLGTIGGTLCALKKEPINHFA